MFAYGRKAKVPSGVWGTLRVIVRGPVFEAYLNGEKRFEVDDHTFEGAGKVGVWTKADSVTYFDDLKDRGAEMSRDTTGRGGRPPMSGSRARR